MEKILNYEILKKAEDTPNAVIYEGRKSGEEQYVLIKVLKSRFNSAAEIARFKQDYRTIVDLDLDGIIKIYDIISEDKKLILIMENFKARYLSDFLKEKNVLDFEFFLKAGIQISETMGGFHKKNIIHRNINPQNILVEPVSGKIKLSGFGIISEIGPDKLQVNTDSNPERYFYVSPEQTGRMNRIVDYRTDYYSLGATFYKMITGKPPFEADDPLEVMHSHIAKEPLPPNQRRTEIPRVISDIILKLLSKDPDDRYQSAFGISEDLKKCLKMIEGKFGIEPFDLAQRDISGKFVMPEKLFGRDRELDILISAFKRISGSGGEPGRTELILLSGGPGIGKSSLINNIYRYVTEQNGYFISGKYEQYRSINPYSSIIQAFQKLIKRILTESKEKIEYMKANLMEALGPNAGIITEVIPELELIIGRQPEVARLGSDEIKNRFYIVFERFVGAFCRKEYPLVLFLDDIHYADLASLQMIRNLAENINIRHLLIICTYRDNEVDETHPLTGIFKDVGSGIFINRIRLAELTINDITDLLVNFLRCTRLKGIALAELICKKTGGNPFFVNEFLHTLHNEGLIEIDPRSGWIWNIEKINDISITDNVIEYLTDKIKRQSSEVQDLLKICSCIGNRFDLEVLTYVYDKPIDETLSVLTEAINEGFVSMSDDFYIFTHNRLQETAYSLVPEEVKITIHHNIGRLILKNINESDRQKKLLYIVDQLNLGSALIDDDMELEELARLNLESGRRTKLSAAFTTALNYLKKAASLLRNDCWEKQYDLALTVFSEAAETAYLLNDIDSMRHYTSEVIGHVKKISDAIPVYITIFMSTDAQFNFKGTVDMAFDVFEKLNFSIPRTPNKIQVLISLLKVRFYLLNKKTRVLIDLPEMTDPVMLAVSRILTFVSKDSYFLNPDLFIFAAAKQVELSIKHGLCDAQIIGYLEMASIFSDRIGNINTGYKLGNIALELIKKLNARAYEGRALTLYYSIIPHWNEHLKSIEAEFLKCHQISMETGGIEWAADSLYKHDYIGFILGTQLDSLEERISENHKTIEQLKETQFLAFHNIVWQAVLNLKGKSGSLTGLSGEIMDEKQMIAYWEGTDSLSILGQFYIIRLMLRYIFTDYRAATEDALKANEYIEAMVGSYVVRDLAFYASIACLALFTDAGIKTRREYKKIVKQSLKKLKKWNRYAPSNNEHRISLIKAEIARTNKNKKAEHYYDIAAEQSKKNSYMIEEALSYELAGKYYLEIGNAVRAEFYINKSFDCYKKWGAQAKLKQLQDMYYTIIPEKDYHKDTANKPSDSALSLIDINTIVKASQIMSREMALKNLLVKMMDIVIENAGAQKGFMILEDSGRYFVEAEADIDKAEANTMESVPLESHDELAVSIVNFVVRTSEKIILNDVSSGTDFSGDPYIARMKPKSILCMPVLNSGKLTGVLYLENNAVTNAFTQERLELLNILTSQMAISIDNAKFYKRLEELVKKRTEELEMSEKRFKDIAYSSADWIWEATKEGEYVYCSEKVEEILGYKPEELIGKTVFDLLPVEDREKARRMIEEIVGKTGKLRDIENWQLTKNGKKIYVSTNGLPIFDAQGNVTGYRGVDKDITDRKLNEMKIQEIMEELSRSNKELEKFAYTVSHDLQEPLRKIQRFGDKLTENTNVSSDEKSMDYLQRMQNAAKRMQILITGLLDFSRVTTRAQPFRNINLKKIVGEIISDLEVRISETNAEVIIDELPEIKADPLQMRQLFQNLIGNALKFRKNDVKPVIKIYEMNYSPDYFCLAVEDNGIGIEEKNYDKIFEVFQRLHGRFEYEGSGIGLAVCKKIVERHGGEIIVKSDPGKGSVFEFTIKKNL